MRTDGVHCRESVVGRESVVLKVVPVTGAAFSVSVTGAPLFSHTLFRYEVGMMCDT